MMTKFYIYNFYYELFALLNRTDENLTFELVLFFLCAGLHVYENVKILNIIFLNKFAKKKKKIAHEMHIRDYDYNRIQSSL